MAELDVILEKLTRIEEKIDKIETEMTGVVKDKDFYYKYIEARDKRRKKEREEYEAKQNEFIKKGRIIELIIKYIGWVFFLISIIVSYILYSKGLI